MNFVAFISNVEFCAKNPFVFAFLNKQFSLTFPLHFLTMESVKTKDQANCILLQNRNKSLHEHSKDTKDFFQKYACRIRRVLSSKASISKLISFYALHFDP